MKIQKRKIGYFKGSYRVSCYDENRLSYMGRSRSISLERCKQCKHFVRRVKDYIYCKKISAPYWLKDKVIMI